MADDKRSEKEATDAAGQALIAQLDHVMTSLWNATVEMDTAALDCKVKAGESLFDRINKCEAAATAWDKALKQLEKELAVLKPAQAAYAAKRNDEAARLAETTYDIALREHGDMSAALKRVRAALVQQKQKIRKVKA